MFLVERKIARRAAALGLLLAAGCAHGATTPPRRAANATAPNAAPGEPIAWADFTPETFARAKRERRFVVLDGAAEWCHWCHVMEATTYHDEAVRKLLADRFIAVKVDVDARPDVEERYVDWGWPATVIFSPDAEELGKYKGYIEPERFVDILRAVVASGAVASARPVEPTASRAPLTEEHLAWIARMTELELEDYYDAEQGGWGRAQKAPLMWNNAWALARAKSGDAEARTRALFALTQQRKIVDPVWGGIYQYSAAGDWDHPHFEKLMTWQAGALDNYAAAYALTKDAAMLDAARAIRRYVDRFMTSPDGGFYATQDADLNAHERGKPFMDGHVYYAKSDADRIALGVPRIDTHEYGRENGLMIAAFATLYEATGDATALATAKRAAVRVLATHTAATGGITHDVVASSKQVYLADNAAMAWGLVRLHEATHEREWLDGATRVLEWMKGALGDDAGGFFATPHDPNAVGVFASRRKPFDENALAIRAMARLARAAGAEAWRPVIAGALRAIATPEQIKGRGRMLGDFLLALEETRGLR